ncbi:von Willebrand factor A domain-containing protein 5B2 isoform X2 [Sarcophilus harrisii]|uniref:von Willebrand factor A domain-containing protein 5B2 isoform X2 n=1 Tax=Sarcophilus harrisii TaxID=9305 RepID=UPI001301CA11|nr:von Willebrand factor A domain-containing protein 5B2 isoform X2 [Sarcophilus harrisii]
MSGASHSSQGNGGSPGKQMLLTCRCCLQPMEMVETPGPHLLAAWRKWLPSGPGTASSHKPLSTSPLLRGAPSPSFPPTASQSGPGSRGIMPGLYCPATWTPLPLKDSWVRACANGPCLGLHARLTYHNPAPEAVEGVFVYPLAEAEAEVVSGFEAEAAGRRVSFQLQSRRWSPSEPCCRELRPEAGLPRRCAQGHLVLDPAQARSTLVLPTGLIASEGTVTVWLRSSRELPTRPDGAIRVALPSILTPLAQSSPARPSGLCDDSPTSCFGVGTPEEEEPPLQDSAAPRDMFCGPARCPGPYTFSFEMLVTGPCLLAGLESPSHALRADAPPHASSAATICITLAEGHPCDRALEILLHPSEPHRPHLTLEAGGLSAAQYEARVRSRRDFQRLLRKDSDGDRQVWFLQRRFHKDILLNPVLVLSFCPDLSAGSPDPASATRECLFLVDSHGATYKDALLLALKSLPPQTFLNIATFGSSVRPLFPGSQPCNDHTLQLACEGVEALKAGWERPDVLAGLRWALEQPAHRGHPRQLFVLTAAAPPAPAAQEALELMRRHGGTARCFSFGLDPACRQLLRGLSALSRGHAYFLAPGERLQPLLLRALRTALEPALSDISVDWFMPDSVEAMLTPREIPTLYPGDRLIGYCSLFRVEGFRPRPPAGQEPGWRSLGGSVFPSPEEPSATSLGTEPTDPAGTGTASSHCGPGDSERSEWGGEGPQEPGKDQLGGSSATLPAGAEPPADPATDPGPDPPSEAALWRRIFHSSYIREQYVLTRCSTSPEPSPASPGSSESPGSWGPGSPDHSAPPAVPSQRGHRSLAWGDPAAASHSCPLPLSGPFTAPPLAPQRPGQPPKTAFAGRSLSTPQGGKDPVPQPRRNRSLGGQLENASPEQRQQLRRSLDDSGNLLSPTPLDWDMLVEPPFMFAPSPSAEESAPSPTGPPPPPPPQPPRCHVAVRALQDGRPVCWEVGAGLEPFLGPSEDPPPPSPQGGEAWDQTLHRLTAASVVRDNEQLALQGAEPGPIRRFRLRALQTSKATAAASLFTCPVAVDAVTREALPGALRVHSSEPAPAPRAESAEDSGQPAGLEDSASASSRDSETSAGSRLSWRRFGSGRRLYTPEPDGRSVAEGAKDRRDHDYLPLVRLQEAAGSFRLDGPFCAAVQIPHERLCRASPFPVHRATLSPASASSPWALLGPGAGGSASGSQSPSSGSEGPGQVDSGHGSDTEASEGAEGPGVPDLRGRGWATAVALAWLEHRCTGTFGEWELVAAKADGWLRAQRLPDGLDLAALKAAARGLFLLLRHWDQNLQLRLLCYSPANV